MALTPLDFPASPTVGTLYPDPPVTGQPTYRWDGAQWLSYAAASLPTPTKPANYGKKNYIINGAMQVSQENGTTTGLGSGYYPVDQFCVFYSMTGTAGSAQVSSATLAGSPTRLRVAANVADTSIAAGEYVQIYQIIEGSRSADLRFGSTSAKTVTLQFGVNAPAGTYCVAISSGDGARNYISEYVITAGEAGTNVVKSIVIPGDTTGTWSTGNTSGIVIHWVLVAGVTYHGVAGSWVGGIPLATSNQFNFMGTAGNIFELFDVSLTEGSVAPPFQVPDYASELALCQRYWQFGFVAWDGWITAGQTLVSMMVDFKVTMRSTPSVFFINGVATGVAAAATAPQILVDGMEVRHTTAAAGVAAFMDTWKVSARL